MGAGMPQPLAGITVLDLTQIYNGPYATFLMARAGADIVKIEPPGGEHLRKRETLPDDVVTVPFAMFNANKRSLCLDLKTDTGRAVLRRLAARADVLVENFTPSAMERLGLGAESLMAANPRLIYASSSGYGSTGPYRDYPAMDLAVQAMSGVLSSTGQPDGDPVKAGPAVCDFMAGIHLYGAIVTALLRRERTGAGGRVEVSMMEAVYPSLASNLGGLRRGNRRPQRTGNRHGGMGLAPYNVYPSADGHVAIITTNEKHWRALVAALDLDALAADPRYATRDARARHMDELDEALGAVTRRLGNAELLARLRARTVPCAPVQELLDVVDDPHLHARGALRHIDHPAYGRILVPDTPLRFLDQEPPPYRPSPGLGSQAREILADLLQCGDDELDRLQAELSP